MRNIFITSVFMIYATCLMGQVAINDINFPDANFRAIVTGSAIDTDNDDTLSTSEIAAVTFLGVSGFGKNNSQKIANLTGIEHFTALTRLDCDTNQLTSLDVSKNTALTYLDCYTNQLTSLDVSKNTALDHLDCDDNQLTSLDVSKNTALTILYCDTNQLTSLNLKNGQNTILIELYASSNPNLTCIQVDDVSAIPSSWEKDAGASYSIDCLYINDINFPDANFRAIVTGGAIDTDNDDVLSESEIAAVTNLNVNGFGKGNNQKIANLKGIEHFTALTVLSCYSNSLASLDVSNNTALTRLNCYRNQLTSLDVSKNTALTGLECYNNQLTSLDVSKNTALTQLYCQTNRLASLDVTNNTALTRLYCNDNQLTSLDVSNNTALEELNCNNNKLSSLNVKNGNNANMTVFDARFNTNLTCIQTDTGVVPSNVFWLKDAGASYSIDCLYINDINFPDANFRAIVTGSAIDTTDDDVLSDSEIQAVASLNVNGSSISDLTGIEYFTALTYLDCRNNRLTSLDVSNNTALTILYCYSNQLPSLDTSNNTALTILWCFSNRLTSLDVSKNTALTTLFCHSNQLKSLDVSKNTALTGLQCYNNLLTSLNVANGNNNILTGLVDFRFNSDLTCIQTDTGAGLSNWQRDNGASYSTRCLYINDINFPDANFRAIVTGNTIDTDNDDVLSDSEIQAVASLDVSGSSISDLTGIEHFTALTRLDCYTNSLTSLDVSKNTALTRLECYTNQLTSLDVSNNTALTTLWCQSNKLTSLDVSKNTALTDLNCETNQLTSLDVSKNTALIELECSSNQLTSLDVSNNTALTTLWCQSNQLTSLDVSKNTALNYLGCEINQLTSLNVKNGQNTILIEFYASDNSDLTCIQVDDVSAIPSSWEKDAGASYSTDCNVYWNGTTDTDWATASNWDGDAVPTISDNVVIRKTSNDPVISSSTSASVSGITINSDASLTIDGTLTVNNNATYIRNLTTTNWYLVSSPVTGETYDDDYVTANSIASSNSNRGISTYNTTNDTWSYMQGGGSGTFTNGKGYSVKRESAGDISFTGTSFNTGDVSIAIDNTGNGFNLIGNPYATHINSNPFLTSNTAKLVTETIWVWDQEDEVYDAIVSTMDFKLAPTQGFFVQAKATATGNLTFDYSAIKSAGGTFQKTDLSQIKLSITDGASKRQARVLYYDAATKGFDNGGDGEVFTGNGANTKFDVYTHLLKDDKGKKYQVQSLPKAEIGSMIIPVGVKAGAGKEITFSIEKLNIPSSIEVILEDRTKGTFTKLDNGNNYKVLTSASDDIGRFYLHTTQATLNILDNRTLSESISVYKTDNSRLRIVGLPTGNATVRIYNILGKEIINSSFSSTGVKDISLPNLSSGIYIMQIETETGRIIKKVVLQ